MKICMIGTGYVGLVTGTCFAESGNDVICVDIDEDKIAGLQQGQIPIYEPGLEEMVERNAEEGRLSFTTDLAEGVRRSDIVFVAVGTPPGEDGSSDLRHVLQASRDIARSMNGPKLIVNKSTVPVGTADKVRREIEALTAHPFTVISNPEFLKEGAAIEDFMKPDRVVVGTEDEEAARVMRELYAPFTRTGAPILVLDTRSSEMAKYAANAMLACRISFMNEISQLCERVGADIDAVRQGIGSDRRIGRSFLFAGLGYGGSCFPKDIKALVSMGHEVGFPLRLVESIETVNERQKMILVEKIDRFYASDAPVRLQRVRQRQEDVTAQLLEEIGREGRRSPVPASDAPPCDLKGKVFALWGLSFKPRTDDMREAPSLRIIDSLLERGASLQAYDPGAMPAARRILKDRISYFDNSYGALEGADALVLVTEWDVFRNPNFQRMRELMRHPVIFDGRNQYRIKSMPGHGFVYYAVGRP